MTAFDPAALDPCADKDVHWLLHAQTMRRGGAPFLNWEPFNGAGRTWSYAEFYAEVRSVAAGLQRQGIPAVCVVPPDAPVVFRHEGVRFVACPATRAGSQVQCSSCGGRWGLPLCAKAARSFVVTFPAHGARAAAADRHCS